jgi:enolase
LSTAVGDEGGFAPTLAGGTEDALDTIKLSVENAGYTFGDEIMIMGCAAAEFYVNGKYLF